MRTRRNALEAIAGATVVGSLSGCVQLATRRTSHFDGTPALLAGESGSKTGDPSILASAVGVEARKTIERVGVEREIVTNSWGMLYRVLSITDTGSSDQHVSVATFTTPSVEVAGQELNPIADLAVEEIGDEFASLSLPETSTGPNEERRLWGRTEYGDLTTNQVDDATGPKVLRSVRDSVGGERRADVEYTDSWTAERTIPDWDGDEYESAISIPDEEAEDVHGAIRFDEHNGDFVVWFATGEGFDSPRLVDRKEDVPAETRETGHVVVHPEEDEFKLEHLVRHLLKTNARGSLGLVGRGRSIVDETRTSLELDEYDRETMLRTISDVQDAIGEIQDTLGGCETDTCRTVLSHAENRWGLAEDARQAIEDGDPASARRALEEIEGIVDEDIAMLEEEDEDRAVELERSLLEDTEGARLAAAQWQTLLSIQEDVDRVDQLFGGLDEDLQAVIDAPLRTTRFEGALESAEDNAERAAEIATGARERVASHNDTRDEEDERFVDIEANLGELVGLSRTIHRAQANGRKTVKARDV